MVHSKIMVLGLLALFTSLACENPQTFETNQDTPRAPMTTAYTPVPTVLPASITLPQDVVDDVVVGTVNPPMQTLADAVAWVTEPLTSGGTFSPTGGLTFDLLGGPFTITGGYGLVIGPGAIFNPNGRVTEHLFNGTGTSGRANRRFRASTITADTIINPSQHDTIRLLPNASGLAAFIDPGVTPSVEGDWMKVYNASGANTLQVKFGPTTIVTIPATTTTCLQWAEFVFSGSGWFLLGGSF